MSARNTVGLLLIGLGVIFLLDTLNVFGKDTNIIGDFWPVLIIAVGLISWARRGFGYALGPILVMAVGGILLVGELTDTGAWRLWPILLILVGLSFILQRQTRAHRSVPSAAAPLGPGAVKISHILSGDARRMDGEFKGGSASVVMGDGKLDLTHATLPADGAVLDVTVVLGSYKVFVPDTWRVAFEAEAFLGAIEDKRGRGAGQESEGPALALRGSVFLGGVEVRS